MIHTTSVAVAAVQGPIADRRLNGMIGARILATALAESLRVIPEYFGTPAVTVSRPWWVDLEAARSLIDEAAAFVERSMTAQHIPLLCLSKCATSLGTLPVIARLRPDTMIVWFDAHGDFNTPDITTTNYLGGLPVAGACGYWTTGFGGELRPEQVVVVGARDLDVPERALMTEAGVHIVPPGPACVAPLMTALGDAPVYIHLDWDVLEPGHIPTEYHVPDGLSPEELRTILTAVVAGREIVGLELAEFEAPNDPDVQHAAVSRALEILAPVLAAVETKTSR